MKWRVLIDRYYRYRSSDPLPIVPNYALLSGKKRRAGLLGQARNKNFVIFKIMTILWHSFTIHLHFGRQGKRGRVKKQIYIPVYSEWAVTPYSVLSQASGWSSDDQREASWLPGEVGGHVGITVPRQNIRWQNVRSYKTSVTKRPEL
jgi:hypothetical protein